MSAVTLWNWKRTRFKIFLLVISMGVLLVIVYRRKQQPQPHQPHQQPQKSIQAILKDIYIIISNQNNVSPKSVLSNSSGGTGKNRNSSDRLSRASNSSSSGERRGVALAVFGNESKGGSRANYLLIRSLIDSMLDPLVVADQECTIKMFNSAATKLFGYSEKEAVGCNVSTLCAPPIADIHHQYVDRYRNTGVPHIIGTEGREVVGLHKSGVVIPLMLSLSECLIGDQVFFIGCMRDLRQLKSIEYLLREATTELRVVMDAMLDPMVVSDESGMMKIFNRAAAKLFGWSEQEVLGLNVTTLMPKNLAKKHPEYLTRFITTGKGTVVGTAGREVTGKHKDGSKIPLLLSLCVATMGGSRVFIACLRDLAAIKLRDEALRVANQQLKGHII